MAYRFHIDINLANETNEAGDAHQMSPTALVVAYEKAQATAFVERALVGHRVHQHKGIRPANLRLQLCLAPILMAVSRRQMYTHSTVYVSLNQSFLSRYINTVYI